MADPRFADERDKLHERWLESGSPSWSDWIYDEAASLRAALREAEAQVDEYRQFVERRAKPSLIGCECPCHEEAAELLARDALREEITHG